MGEAYWDWREAQLAHHDGRAVGGEPCVICDAPVPPGAHWKHRDRHVCSPSCNQKLSRRFTRQRKDLDPPVDVDPYADRDPMVFLTDVTEPFAYGFLGLSPRDGDVVVRHDSTTIYEQVRYGPEVLDAMEERASVATEPGEAEFWRSRAHSTMACVHVESGSVLTARVDENGTLGRLVYDVVAADGTQVAFQVPFEAAGRSWSWRTETIRHSDEAGTESSWRAYVCVPDPPPAPWEGRMWTPAYTARSERLARISASIARHARRQRMVGPDGTVERVDPVAIFERDRWVCQLCVKPIDPALGHPDPMSASLDHRIPLIAGGTHVEANVQASHLRCNIIKSGRVPDR